LPAQMKGQIDVSIAEHDREAVEPLPVLDYAAARVLQVAGRSRDLLRQLKPSAAGADPRLGVLRGVALALTGRRNAAKRWLRIRFDPASAAEASDLGLASLLLGDTGRAVTLLASAVRDDPADAVAHGRLAAAQLERGELAAAERHYLEAVNREPGRAEWHSNLAGILARQQRFEAALEHYRQALHLNPD